ncbi:MAG: HD-GYP domain-containing protein [Thermodesulfovibrionales bacterium]|nr:HD-GYP domain-containing protein [Thermodesulfovibrionales bacterium]
MKRYIIPKDTKLDKVDNDDRKEDNGLAIQKKYYHDIERYYQIEKKALIPDSEVPFEVYVHKNFSFKSLFKASPSQPKKITSDLINVDGDLMIINSDLPLYNEYLESMEKKLSSAKTDKEIKAVVTKEKTKIMMRNVLNEPRCGEKIKEAKKAVETIASLIFENRDTLYNLISIKNYDYYTYTHSVNVAVLSIGLGITINLPSEKIATLGLGSLLHDIGKSIISAEILNKPTRLSPLEYQIMKSHVIEGKRILEKHDFFPKESFYAITQHHEKLSGKGYPLGLKEPEIKLFGRICAIADCYDALTTQRPYKPAYSPFEALKIILNDSGDYDPELIKVFIKMLGKIE